MRIRRQLNQTKRRGQAMVEYSILNAVLVVGFIIISNVPITMDGSGQGRNMIELFLEFYQAYYDSFYFILSLPFP